MENYLVWILAALVMAIIIASVMYFMFFSLNFNYPNSYMSTAHSPTITVSASGSASSSSNQATLFLVMNGTGATTAAALQNLSSTLNQFNLTIKNYIGGNFSNVTTTYFNVYPRINYTYNYTSDTYRSYKNGYVATEDVSVVFPDISSVGSAVSSLSSIPNIYTSSISQSLSNVKVQSLRKEALSDALANATEQAQALAGNGANLVVRNITEVNYYYFPMPRSLDVAATSAYNGTVTYYGGMSTVTESINVVFSKT